MNKEEFIKQRCEIDKITEEEFEKRYRVVKCNCGQPYCKGYRCLDLDDLLKENQELKKKYENAVVDYETTMFEKEQLNSLVNSCQEEIRQLKKQLKEKLDKYENPEDMTLFAMWCTEKVKEENQKLQTIANNCKQLKDNWNKLKEYIKTIYKGCPPHEKEVLMFITDKIQELENGDSNEI